MSKSRDGAVAITEVAISEIDFALTHHSDPSTRMQLVNAITGYINGTLTHDQCQKIFHANHFHSETLERMRQIKECDDKPLDSPKVAADDTKKTRPWTTPEDIRLLAGIYRYGLDNWSTVAFFVGNGRTRGQCAQRWSRGLNPRLSKDTWSTEEERMLVMLVRNFGDKAWTRIAAIMGHRSDVQCRYHYQQMAKGKGSGFTTVVPPQFTTIQQPRFSLPRVAFQPVQTVQLVAAAQHQMRRTSAPAFTNDAKPQRLSDDHNLDKFLKNFQ